MNSISPKEVVESYSNIGADKTTMKTGKLLVLGILAGMIIAFGSAATSTAAFAFTNISIIKIVTGLLFPFGLAMVILTGAELFTGNILIVISMFDKKAKLKGLLRNWFIVYMGNFIGSLIVVLGGVYFGQLDYGDGALAMYTIEIAAAKCAMPFSRAFVMGFLCNFLVTLAVVISMTAKDTLGKMAASFVPVAYFVFSGYEHSVANMYYIPAGILASHITSYQEQAVAMGIDMSHLNTMGLIVGNLIPVTLGNIAGGMALAFIMWYSHKKK
ncbi:MAG: formate/nitrite transporter family protein [Clostridiales bacterium]|nr:formate/nitrite transporter family protein [Clostridiales bacterium]